jgi:membrane protease YdiL (CAAX protease family)
MDPTGPGALASSGRVPSSALDPSSPRFRLYDPLLVFVAGLLGGAVLGTVGYGISGDEAGDPGALTVGLGFVGQFAAYGCVTWVLCRRRGTGSLSRDVGFRAHWRDAWAFPLGIACAIGFGLVVFPLRELVDQNQTVVEELNDASGAKLAVFAIAAGLLAPVFEELLFRGLLLRALLWRMSTAWAIAVSALLFGAVHFLGGNFLGTLAVLPALVGLGVISAVFAARTGELSRSILLHMGFNVLAVIGALAG